MDDRPKWMRGREAVVARACLLLVVLVAVAQVRELFVEDDNPWTAMALLYLSAAAIGVDAVACGVRKRTDEGISIRNLAPGGWAIFAGMFWIVAVPAYYVRRARRTRDAGPFEPVTVGSWIGIGTFAAIGIALALVAFTR